MQAGPTPGTAEAPADWAIGVQLQNTLPGPWDASRLPLTALQANATYDGTRWTLPGASASARECPRRSDTAPAFVLLATVTMPTATRHAPSPAANASRSGTASLRLPAPSAYVIRAIVPWQGISPPVTPSTVGLVMCACSICAA